MITSPGRFFVSRHRLFSLDEGARADHEDQRERADELAVPQGAAADQDGRGQRDLAGDAHGQALDEHRERAGRKGQRLRVLGPDPVVQLDTGFDIAGPNANRNANARRGNCGVGCRDHVHCHDHHDHQRRWDDGEHDRWGGRIRGGPAILRV